MKSVVHIADFSPVYSGNFIASLRAAAAECHARGLRVVWVFPDDVRDFEWFKQLQAMPQTASYTLSRQDGLWESTRRIRSIVRAEDAAIVHTHFSRFDIAAWVAWLTCAAHFRPFHLVWHVHSAFPPESSLLRRAKDFLKLGVMGRSCTIVAVSEAVRGEVAARGCPRRQIRVIENGIDVAHATLRKRQRQEVRAQLNVPMDAWMLLGFGWLPVTKGVDTMLRALKALRARGKNAVLVLVGTDDLRRFLDAWPDDSCRPFLRMIPPTEQVGDLFGAADVFLSASRAEGFCYSVAEAMLNGLPVAGSRIPALAWAFSAPAVFFFEPENAGQLADVIERIQSRTAAETSGEAEPARAFVIERHSVEKWARSVIALYQELIGQELMGDGGKTAPRLIPVAGRRGEGL